MCDRLPRPTARELALLKRLRKARKTMTAARALIGEAPARVSNAERAAMLGEIDEFLQTFTKPLT